VSGTDISQFAAFRTGADGIEYERHINAVLDRLEAVNAPTLAAVRGSCRRGGLAITACATCASLLDRPVSACPARARAATPLRFLRVPGWRRNSDPADYST